MRHQSDLSLALVAMFASGGMFALLTATVLPPERPVEWYLAATVAGMALVIAVAVFLIGRRITLTYAAWLSSIYILLLVLLVVRASNLSRATVAGLMLVVVIVLFAWFMPVWYSRVVGYTALSVICIILVIRFPTNDGFLTVIAFFSLTILLTEVFGSFKRNLQRASLTDHLTGTWNRAGFERLLDTQIRTLQRTADPLSIMYLDLDDFKSVNDALGHHSGDEVLRNTAAALTESVRASDSVARIGGDEFVVLLPGATASEVHTLAKRLKNEVQVSAWSYGIAEYEPGETAQEFVKRSDAEMMRMKRQRGSVSGDR